jgi:hypothetical protein
MLTEAQQAQTVGASMLIISTSIKMPLIQSFDIGPSNKKDKATKKKDFRQKKRTTAQIYFLFNK